MLDYLHLVSWVLVDLHQKKKRVTKPPQVGYSVFRRAMQQAHSCFPKRMYSYKGGDKSVIPRGTSEWKLPSFANRQNHQSQRLKVTLASLAYCEPSLNPIHWIWVLPSLVGLGMRVTWVPVSNSVIQLGFFSFPKFLGILRWVHMALGPTVHHLFPLKQLWSG